MTLQAIRYHDFCAGHRVHGHESKCAHLHGHNYRAYLTVEGGKDSLGRVMDFSVIKEKLCLWLEENWDHKFLVWHNDPIQHHLKALDFHGTVVVPFNPTAENMAQHLVDYVGPQQLKGSGCTLTSVTMEETRKCSARYSI